MSAGTTTASSSSGTGGSPAGTFVTLYDNLLGPEAIAIDADNVYFTLNDGAAKAMSGAGYVSKDGTKKDLWYSLQDSVPAIWSTGSLIYIAANLGTKGTIYAFDVTASSVTGLASVSDATLGVAVWGSTVYFTTQGSSPWVLPPAGSPQSFAPGTIAAGPITADATGVYFPTATALMLSAPLGGAGSTTTLAMVPDTVYAVTTDATSVYWTDQSGGLYRAPKSASGVKTVVAPDTTPAYGLGIDPSTSTLYYAHGQSVETVAFPFSQAPTILAKGLSNPRGVAVDSGWVYVAVQGSGTAADGSIIKIAR
jgi:hypothetical protein